MKICTIFILLVALISAEIQNISSTLEGPIHEHKHEYSSEQDQLFWEFLGWESRKIDFWLAKNSEIMIDWKESMIELETPCVMIKCQKFGESMCDETRSMESCR